MVTVWRRRTSSGWQSQASQTPGLIHGRKALAFGCKVEPMDQMMGMGIEPHDPFDRPVRHLNLNLPKTISIGLFPFILFKRSTLLAIRW
jgi:hypothetical protein